MPALHSVFCDPTMPKRTGAEALDRQILSPLGRSTGLAPDGPLSFVEAIAWVATRDLEVVAGVSPFKRNAICMIRRAYGKESASFRDPDLQWISRVDDDWVSSVLADDIAAAYCSCDRAPACRYDREDWDKLSPVEQQKAAADPAARYRGLYMGVYSIHCRCTDAAALALIGAAAVGRLTGRHIVNGRPQSMARIVWDHADFDLSGGLTCRDFKPVGVTFAWRDLRRIWPKGSGLVVVADGSDPLFTVQPGAGRAPTARRPRGRPTVAADIIAIFEQLAALPGRPPKSLREASRLCVEEAKRRKIANVGLPRAYERHLRPYWSKIAVRTKNQP